MGAGHDHGHTHGGPAPTGTAAAAYKGRLRIALGITLAVTVMEIVGGLLSGSLALIADAAHMATDALGLGMALLAIHFANKPAGPNRTFGYARAEILAALANCVLLLGVGGYLLFEAVERFISPAETRGGLTVAFALVGLVANMISLSLLVRGQKDSLNVRGAYLEVLADTLGSVTVLISAGIIMATGWQAADPIASLVIGLMIVPRTVKLLRETLNVLLESAPQGVDMDEVRDHITALPGVLDVHDLHAWTITSGMPVLSAHVVVRQELLDSMGHEKLLHELQGCLGDHFDLEHCTFQLEPSGHAEHEVRLCH
ncbi:cation diffusion facilitator family transporter [Streptomyces sp. NBC_00876]|uniref:cation diffusion facilitator family transporter n=1 Tax=Streptomyces sp. NBC_00876 TaxID=2975853 RepID=UPI003865C64C|nr:cation diffusion facilitator family transporter [Streptomyces sp. NBC_00876]